MPAVAWETGSVTYRNGPFACQAQVGVPCITVAPSKNVKLQLGITPKKFMVRITPMLKGVATCGGIGGFEDMILVAPGVTVIE
ncbi:MAG: hypothetical protein AUH86_20545 [Acidobacteria bacterium 13_1_40CM_4_58_4]|nr:MAG: hypothetical protein AUH86_20545 [Acidobacteria bacterium 13_1_40CM_4_58_4]